MPQAQGSKTALPAFDENYLVGFHPRPHHHLLFLCTRIWQSHARTKKPPGIPGGLKT